MYPQFRYSKAFEKGLIFNFLWLGLIFNYHLTKAQCTNLNLFATNSALNCLSSTASGTVQCFNCTGTVSYTWLPVGGNSAVANNLPPNSYTILAQDGIGCTGSTNLIILNNSSVNVFMGALTPPCSGSGSGTVTANVVGPANFPLTYSWTPAAPNASVITGSPGTYSVLVTDNIGCTYTGSTTMNSPNTITTSIVTKSITCNGGLSSATITASGGSGPLSYSWAPVAGTGTILNNIPAGDYTCTVKDGSGCVTIATVNITEPAAMQNTLNLTHVTCNTFTNGQAVSNVAGGTPAYSYTWAPINANGSSVSGLSAGNYTFIVKDAKGCVVSQSFAITQPAPITYTFTQTNEFCINADGTATVNVSGGNGGYTYSWTTTPAQTNSVAINLTAGNYSVYITDSKNCKNNGAVTIGNISNLSGQITSQTNVSCNGTCDGKATANVSGGSSPYSYNWLGIPTGTQATVTNLCPGTYTVKITDGLGCYTHTSVTITEPSVLSYSVGGNYIICHGKNTSLTATVNGGTPGYTYNWQPGSLTGNSITVSPTITTGFSLTVTDSKGCTGAVKVYSVTVGAPISINTGANSLTVCPNVSTSITVNANGGDGNYSYLWMPGSLNTNSIVVNLQNSTIYTVTISDGCGSTPVSTTVNITVYQVQNPSFSTSNASGCEPVCTQFNNTSTGTTTALWNFGDFSPPVQAPSATHCYTNAGIYSVALTITNSFGCKFTLVKQNIITVHAKPIADFVQEPELLDLNNNTAVFTNASVNGTSFVWALDGLPLSTGGSVEHMFTDVGCYNLKLIASSQSSCADTIEKQVCVTEGFNFWMPNAFSPDKDTTNNLFFPKGTGWANDGYLFEVYNRWGVLIFKTNETTGAWDGNYGGSKATDEIYVWRVFVRDIYDKEHEYQGHVLIMR